MKKAKDKLIAARVDEDLLKQVNEYIESMWLSLGDLIRMALEEYIKNHPIKKVGK